jgi:hypothetical protein
MLRVEAPVPGTAVPRAGSTGWPFWTQTVLTMGDLTLAIKLAEQPGVLGERHRPASDRP